MKSLKIILPFTFIVYALLSYGPISAHAQQTAMVTGNVFNRMNIPVPGVTVFLVHPLVGRSYPSITNQMGYYVFNNVPLSRDPYYLEIYWGNDLIFRNTLSVYRGAPGTQASPYGATIVVPPIGLP